MNKILEDVVAYCSLVGILATPIAALELEDCQYKYYHPKTISRNEIYKRVNKRINEKKVLGINGKPVEQSFYQEDH